MSDDKKPLSGQAALIGLLYELAKTNSALEKGIERMIREQEKTRALLEVFVGVDTTNDATPATATASTSSATPAAPPAPSSGMEGLLEELIAEEMGISPDALRTGQLDKEVMRKLIRDAKAKKTAAGATT